MKTNNMTPTAKHFIKRLKTYQSPIEREKTLRYFKTPTNGEADEFIGVRMGQVFALVKEFITMTPDEIEKLLESKIHEVRAGACSIMDKQARSKKTTPERRKELYDLYLRRHDRINNWDLVDVSCPTILGTYLLDKDKSVLYKLAKSKSLWKERIAMVTTLWFVRYQKLDDAIKIADILLDHKHDLIHKAVGWVLREVGKKDEKVLEKYLQKNYKNIPRTTLRYAIEKFPELKRKRYLRGEFK